jgi:cytoskeletal protein CcmA (bactofilin family)
MPTYDGIGETITHKLEIEGDMFLQDIEGGTNSTQVPLEIFSDFTSSNDESINSRMLRLRVNNLNAIQDDNSNIYVTDMGIKGQVDKDYFFITAPQNTSNFGDQNTFVISKTSNVGIGTTDPGHYRLLVNNSSTKHFGVPGNDTPTTGDTLVYNENGEWVYSFPAGNLPAGSVDNEILTWNGANWVPNRSIRTTNSNTAIGIGTYEPLANLHVIGSVTATSDVDISGKFQGGRLRVGSVLSPDPTNPNVTVPGDLTVSGTLTSDEWIHTSNLDITGNIHVDHDFLIDGTYQGTGMRLDGTLHNLSGAIPDLSVAGSITATGDIKTDQTFRGTDASITGTLTTSNITHGSELTVTTNLLMGPGTTLTASNIVGASPVTISSSIVMAAGTTLTTAAIEPPTGAESNLKITGTITTSNIVANTGDSLLVSSNLEVGTSNLFVDTSTGRVGIGTTSPGNTLHVNGDSKMNRIFTEGVNYTGFSEFSWTNTANIGTGHVCGLLSISSTSGGNRSMYVVTQNTSGTDFVLLSGGGYTVQKSGDYIQVKTTINYFTVSYWSWIRLL